MAIEFPCSQCHRTLRVPDDAAGRQAKCPSCQAISTVPQGQTAQPTAFAPPPQDFSPQAEPDANPYASPEFAQEYAFTPPADHHPSIRNPNNWATRWERLGGAILDGLINMVGVLPGVVLLFVLAAANRNFGNRPELLFAPIALIFVGLFAILGYQWYLISTTGQSLGKKAVGTRIVNYSNGRNPGFVNAVILRAWVPGLIGAVPYIGGCFGWINIFWIFGRERRCVHDLIAGTMVVKASLQQ